MPYNQGMTHANRSIRHLPTLLKPIALPASALACSLWLVTPAIAVPIGTTPDTRPAAPQQRTQYKSVGYGFEFGGSFLQGNANLTNLEASGNFNANQGPHQLFLDLGGLFTRAGSSTLVNRVSGSGLYAYALNDHWNAYGYTTSSHDDAIRLNYRLTNGVGLCVHHLAEPLFSQLLFSAGPSYENGWFSTGVTSAAWRSVLRANAARSLSPTTEVDLDTFYSPNLVDGSDYRLYGEASLKVKLTEALTLILTAADEFDNRPQPGILNNDAGLFTSLRADWGH